MVMDIVCYNNELASKFSSSPNPTILLQYIVSEILPPICDYENAIKIVQENYPTYADYTALIIGAYLFSEWCVGRNELLGELNQIIDGLPEKEKAIVYFLNANHLRHIDENYAKNPAYLHNLIKSTEIQIPFVRNWLWFSELQTSSEQAKVCISTANNNVQKVYSSQEISELLIEQMATPDFYINEHILGTHLSYAVYELLFKSTCSGKLML